MDMGQEMPSLAHSGNTWHLHFAGTLGQLWTSALSTVLCVSQEMTERASEFLYVKKAHKVSNVRLAVEHGNTLTLGGLPSAFFPSIIVSASSFSLAKDDSLHKRHGELHMYIFIHHHVFHPYLFAYHPKSLLGYSQLQKSSRNHQRNNQSCE